jgi:hypothetical protein
MAGASGARRKLWGWDGPQPGRWADLHHGDRHRRAGGQAAGLLHQRGGAGTAGERHHQHRSETAGGGMGFCAGDGLLEQLPVADRPGGTAVLLPLGRHHHRAPAQLIGGAGNGGIGTTGTTVQNQMHQPAAAAGEQLSGNALMGPGQIPTATGRDHKRAGGGLDGLRQYTKIHGFSCRR